MRMDNRSGLHLSVVDKTFRTKGFGSLTVVAHSF